MSLVGLLANLLAIPWVTLVVTPLALPGVLAAPLWDVAAWAVQALGVVLQWLAACPFATLSVPAPPLWAGRRRRRRAACCWRCGCPGRLRLLGLPLLLPVLLWQAPRPPPGEFDLLAADIGQGNAVLVRTAATQRCCTTPGPRYSPESDAGHRVLVPLLRALGERLDTVVLSHRDSDHTGGAAAVLAMQPQAALLSSIEDGHPLQSLRPAQRCVAGQRWAVGRRATSRCCIRWPPTTRRRARPNAISLRAAHRQRPRTPRCWPATSSGAQEAALLARAAGRRPARPTCCWCRTTAARPRRAPPLLDAVRAARWRWCRPATATASAIRRREVLARYAGARHRAGRLAPLRRGALVERGARRAVECERDGARRYWHHRVP